MQNPAIGVIVLAVGLAAAGGCGGHVDEFPNYRVKDHATDAQYLVRGVPKLSRNGDISFQLGRSDEWVTLHEYSLELLNRREYLWAGMRRPPPWGVPASAKAEQDFGLEQSDDQEITGESPR